MIGRRLGLPAQESIALAADQCPLLFDIPLRGAIGGHRERHQLQRGLELLRHNLVRAAGQQAWDFGHKPGPHNDAQVGVHAVGDRRDTARRYRVGDRNDQHLGSLQSRLMQ